MYNATADHDRNGSTALHIDVTSAVNILTYSRPSASQPNSSGAMWHIFLAKDTPALRDYLRGRNPGGPHDPIHAQQTYVTKAMLSELASRNLKPFVIEQQVGDAVFIPAGCAHQVGSPLSHCGNHTDDYSTALTHNRSFSQVSNNAACIKIAMDFLCVEGIQASASVTEDFRSIRVPDILQLEAMMWHAYVSISHKLSQLGGVTQPRRRRRPTTSSRDDRVRRKRARKGAQDRSAVCDRPCPHPSCSRSTRTYTEYLDVFNHLYVLARHVSFYPLTQILGRMFTK